MGKTPAFQFYPGDWLRDEVAGCSLAAQGLWLRMLFQMHDSERHGYLEVNGAALAPEVIARRAGTDLQTYSVLLAELDSVNVPGRTPEGTIYNRRMVRDEAERAKERDKKRRQRGQTTPVPPDVPCLSPTVSRHCPHPSSSSSSSSPSGICESVPRARVCAREGPPTDLARCTAFQANVEETCIRLMGRDLDVNELHTLATFCVEVEGKAPLRIRGSLAGAVEVGTKAVAEAERAKVNGSVKGVVGYVRKVLDRCYRQGCWPNESVDAEPAKLTPVGKDRTAENAAIVAALEKSNAARASR